MLRALFLGMLLFASPFLSTAWAENKTEPPQAGRLFPFTKATFQWDYSCAAGVACSFACTGGGASHLIKLSLYLGTVPLIAAKALLLYFTNSTREKFPIRAASA